jgi:hypothetical protein
LPIHWHCRQLHGVVQRQDVPCKEILGLRYQAIQCEHLIDVSLGLSESRRQLVDRSTFVEQPLIAGGFIERSHVLVMKVGDDHLFLGRVLVDVANANGDRAALRQLCGGQPSPSIDQLEPVPVWADEDRLEHAPLTDAGGKLLQFLF